MSKTVCLGGEFDPALRSSLREVLEEYGVTGDGAWWTVGGPLDTQRTEVLAGGHFLTIESDTYVGLMLTGDADLVEEISGRVRERLLAAG